MDETNLQGMRLNETSEEFCEKENIIKPSYMQRLTTPINEKVILKDNNLSTHNRIPENNHEADSTDKADLISGRLSKRSGPLSPIDSISLYKPSNSSSLLEPRINKGELNDPPTILGNDASQEVQLFSDSSLMDMSSSLQAPQKFDEK